MVLSALWFFPILIYGVICGKAKSASRRNCRRSNLAVAQSIFVSAPNSAYSSTAATPSSTCARRAPFRTSCELFIVKPGDPFVLQPREFALAITEEKLELDDDVLGRLEGRSSLGRIGIIVHGTAGLFDPGWRGKATLELSNLGIMPVALYPGMRICSFTFEQLSSPVSVPYYKKAGNKYAGQTPPLASRLTSEDDKPGQT